MSAKSDYKSNESATLRYRMSSKDEFYGGGIVNGSRAITLMCDVAEKLVNKVFGNNGRCTEVESIRLHSPIHAGDYMEFIARVIDRKDDCIKIGCRSFKIAGIPEEPEFPSSIDVLEEPTISTDMIIVYKSRDD
ncbi:hotdog fold domain-containing protein [Anaerosalibacter massiliensis]|uniref:Hotdog fold thioesterase n=1 Tax=Anaerosalibacter massiliensis TaxID=1347392 RepID=A0A9X2S5W6_9FIRM|nr:hotdog fold domain-containing protein [Anaerosalibacter massiliensis]MCR2043007.1 hotdog fold thioesterase [Anaerosalibacter massiliensis]